MRNASNKEARVGSVSSLIPDLSIQVEESDSDRPCYHASKLTEEGERGKPRNEFHPLLSFDASPFAPTFSPCTVPRLVTGTERADKNILRGWIV